MKKIELDELHAELLKMAGALHKICVENEVPYYMLGGTMLGAVRHKGFIPWDDDMDFGVPREHFDKLLMLLDEKLPDRYRLLTYKNSKCNTLTVKVEIVGSKIVDDREKESWCGVNIDIFPLDYSNLSKNIFSVNWLSHLLVKYNVYAFPQSEKAPFVKKVISKLNFLSKSVTINCIRSLSLMRKDNYTALANHAGFWGLKEIIDKDVFGQPKLYDFDGISLFGVENPDAYLSCLYSNYMELPPDAKRHVHCSEVYI